MKLKEFSSRVITSNPAWSHFATDHEETETTLDWWSAAWEKYARGFYQGARHEWTSGRHTAPVGIIEDLKRDAVELRRLAEIYLSEAGQVLLRSTLVDAHDRRTNPKIGSKVRILQFEKNGPPSKAQPEGELVDVSHSEPFYCVRLGDDFEWVHSVEEIR